MDAKCAWVFKMPQNDALMADAIASYMEKHGVKTVGFIGFADAYGDGWYNVFNTAASAHKLKDRYNRTDTSVTGQVLKTMSANPDAVLIAGVVLTAFIALLLGLVTMRLSGHFLPLGTIAWGLSLFYLFGWHLESGRSIY